MECIERYNDEQFRMLCLLVMDTTSGVCLFQCEDPEMQSDVANKIQEQIGKKTCILDMTKLNSIDMPDEIGKLEKLLEGHKEEQVVILCNLQLCGATLGDEQYIQKLNYMRDQMLVRNKVWVLGMSPYFAVLLSREARDLYSCIMGHFTLRKESEDEQLAFEGVEDCTGDVRLALTRFRELKHRIREQDMSMVEQEMLLQITEVWNKVHDYVFQSNIVAWMRNVLEELCVRMDKMQFATSECMLFQQVAIAWFYIGDYQKAIETEQIMIKKAECVLPQRDREWGELYRWTGRIYYQIKDYDSAELYLNRALEQYVEYQNELMFEQVKMFDLIAQIKLLRGDVDEAINIYKNIINRTEREFGEKYYYLLTLWNNMGVTYFSEERYSEALQCYLQADNDVYYVSSDTSQRSKINVKKNIGKTYERIGNYMKSIEYLREAENILNSYNRSRWRDKFAIYIYRLLSKDYDAIGQEDVALEYRQKADSVREKMKTI